VVANPVTPAPTITVPPTGSTPVPLDLNNLTNPVFLPQISR
jgi:hypothetical protein